MAQFMLDQDHSHMDCSPGWKLSLFGAWHLSCPGGCVDVGANGRRLFTALALRGPSERSHLAGLLWPDHTDRHAMDNMRATLSRLHRRHLDSILEETHGLLALRGGLDVDVWRLTAAAAAVLNGGPIPAGRDALKDLAVEELLVSWSDEWVLLERDRLRHLQLHALEALSSRLLASGDVMTGVEAALAAAAIDPLRESAHHALIEALIAQGNRAEAVRQLQRLRHLLLSELGVEPSPSIVALVRRA